jgi:uroporphyrinogen III methyltransferase/synthase
MSLLNGVRVVVTRAPHQSAELVERLQVAGAVPLVMPVIDIVEPDDGGVALEVAFANMPRYDWLVVTSVNTVDRFLMFEPHPGLRIAAIGSGTAERLRAEHFEVDLVPPQFVAESLLEVFPEGNGRILLPRAAVARDVLPDGLRKKGWTVDVVHAYKTIQVTPLPDVLDQALSADVVTFTSPSTVRAFLHASGERHPSGVVASIGPVTEAALREADVHVDVVATPHTVEGLVQGLIGHFGRI